MFGYIKTYKPELKICEYDAYKAVYCTLCKQLRKDYGFLARFTLNFDYTFLAMIRMSFLESTAQIKKARCPFNPLAKCNHITCDDSSLAYSTAVGVMMTYYKLKDTLADERWFRKIPVWLILPFASSWHKKASKRYPRAAQIISSYVTQQMQTEQSGQQGFDCYCHPTANALSKLFAFDIANEDDRNAIERIGYHVGKWVYMIDALDDWQKDQKQCRFNPLVCRLGKGATADEVCSFVEHQSNWCLDTACEIYDQMNHRTFSPIIRNIFVLGLTQVQNEIIRKVKEYE